MTNEEIENLIKQLEKLKLVFKDFEDDADMKRHVSELIRFLEMLPRMD